MRILPAIPHQKVTYAGSTHGMIAPIMAMMLSAIMALMLLSLETRNTLNAKSALQQACDITALHLARYLYDRSVAGTAESVTHAELTAQAQTLFQDRLTGTVQALSALNVTYTLQSGIYTVNVAYTARLHNFAEAYSYSLSGSSTARINTVMTLFTELHILLDFSASMSMGADSADQIALWETQNCAFACHQTNIEAARDSNILLRQDKLIQTLHSLVDAYEDTISNHGLLANAVVFHFWIFSGSESVEEAGDSHDLLQIRDDINALATRYPTGNTDILNGLLGVIADETTQSDEYTAWLRNTGTSIEDRKPAFVIVTDGISNEGHREYQAPGGTGLPKFEEGGIYANICETLKSTFDLKLGIVFVPHEPYNTRMAQVFGGSTANDGADPSIPYFNQTYSQWTRHVIHYMSRPLRRAEAVFRDCASQDFYFDTRDQSAIQTAFSDYFQSLKQIAPPDPYLVS